MTILKELKTLWKEREETLKESALYYGKHRKAVGRLQEIQRNINDLLKRNSEEND